MSDFEKQLNKTAKGIKLTVAEKRELEARVVSFMEYHPRREKVAAEKAQAYLASQPYSILSFNNKYLQAALGAFAVFVFIVVPTVAERAIPGDVLYPINVRVNEEVRSTLTFSPTQKIEWETERLERRISEVRLLESKGALTEETEAEAVKAVQAHAAAAQNGINKRRTTDAEEASLAEVAFESALDVQTFVLDSDGSENQEAGLAGVVRTAKANALAAKGTTTPSHEKLVARLEIETTRAYELFDSLDGAATPEEKNEIERRLADLERKIESGVSDKEAGVESVKLINALSDSRKLISFMTDIDVRNSVSLETLLPVERTPEEKFSLVAENKDLADKVIARINSLEEGVVDVAIMEKIQVGVKAIKALKLQLEEMGNVDNLDEQVTLSKEIKVMALDIEKLLEPYKSDIPKVEGEDTKATNTASTTGEVATSTTASTTKKVVN